MLVFWAFCLSILRNAEAFAWSTDGAGTCPSRQIFFSKYFPGDVSGGDQDCFGPGDGAVGCRDAADSSSTLNKMTIRQLSDAGEGQASCLCMVQIIFISGKNEANCSSALGFGCCLVRLRSHFKLVGP